MTGWSVLLLAQPEDPSGPMVSRLPAFLHPTAGRPLAWHTLNVLTALGDVVPSVSILAPPDFIDPGLFEEMPFEVHWHPYQPASQPDPSALPEAGEVLVLDAAATYSMRALAKVLAAGPGAWMGDDETALAAYLPAGRVAELLREADPFRVSNGHLRPDERLPPDTDVVAVRTRHDLASATRRIRDALVRSLMDGGVTFILPETVVLDVDVRIGRDTVIYPGVTLEGQTTVGDETVIGPGCRIINSWVGSGVELKGWNYIANTSVRNRAILEPYVRRGFD